MTRTVISPAEFAVALEQRRKAKLRKAPVLPVAPELTDEQMQAKMEFLAADNARIKAELIDAGHYQGLKDADFAEYADNLFASMSKQR